MLSNVEHQWYTAYGNVYDMMALRGYTPRAGSERVPSLQAFDVMYQAWNGPGNVKARWFYFDHPTEPSTHVSFILSKIGAQQHVAIDPKTTIIQYMIGYQDELRRKAGANHTRRDVTLNCIIVIAEITGPARNLLEPFAPKMLTRQDLANDFTPTLEVFLYTELLINPLKYCMQPETRLITDEGEKEDLRRFLVRDAIDKKAGLEFLLPLIRFGRPLTVWYGAKIGDVFFFNRELGGSQGYYRIVVPEPPTKEKVGKKKKTEADQDE